MKSLQHLDVDVLKHILRYCENIELLLGRFGKEFSIFQNDIAYRDSVSMNILQIGELVGHLSEGYRLATQEEIPWRAIKSMRNLFAHNYGNMDFNIIWATALESIPQLKDFCSEQICLLDVSGTEEDEGFDDEILI